MSRALTAAAMVALAGATVTGGVLLSGGKRVGENLPKSVPDFLDKGHGFACVKGLFEGITSLKDDSKQLSNSNKVESSFFPISDTSSAVSGCLEVQWERRKSTKANETDKWTGDFRFLWTMAKGQKGFAVFAVGKPSKSGSDHKAKFQGVALGLENKNVGGWTVTHVHKVDSDKELDKDKFPKAKSTLEGFGANKTKWGFFEDGDLANICGDNECGADAAMAAKDSCRRRWKLQTGTGKASEWTTNLDEWWKTLFEETNWKMGDVVANLQGTWKPEQLAEN